MQSITVYHKGKPYIVWVDVEDYKKTKQYKWYLNVRNDKVVSVYAIPPKGRNNPLLRQRIEYSTVYLHRFVLGLKDPTVHVDHIDRNPLNNCKSNLRTCTIAENNLNRVRKGNNTYKGVYKAKNRYIVKIQIDGIRLNVSGSYETEEEAARVYDKLARKLHGEFASLNFPESSD